MEAASRSYIPCISKESIAQKSNAWAGARTDTSSNPVDCEVGGHVTNWAIHYLIELGF